MPFLKIKNSNLKFLEAKNLCGVVKEVAQLNDKDTPLFMEFCESLKALNYKDLPPNLVLTKLLSTIFVGFSKSISFQTCDVCGQSLKNFYFLNFLPIMGSAESSSWLNTLKIPIRIT